MYVFVHAGGWGIDKWQNSVHVVVECPLIHKSVVRAPVQVSDHFRSYRSLLHSEQLILKVAIGGNATLMGRFRENPFTYSRQVGISEKTSM